MESLTTRCTNVRIFLGFVALGFFDDFVVLPGVVGDTVEVDNPHINDGCGSCFEEVADAQVALQQLGQLLERGSRGAVWVQLSGQGMGCPSVH